VADVVAAGDVHQRLTGSAARHSPAGLYSLQWLHNATPPEFHLQLGKDEPQIWIGFVIFTLLAGLRRHDPHLLDGLRAG
jgi:hypothetical protein